MGKKENLLIGAVIVGLVGLGNLARAEDQAPAAGQPAPEATDAGHHGKMHKDHKAGGKKHKGEKGSCKGKEGCKGKGSCKGEGKKDEKKEEAPAK